jgi:hypothetical protein
MTVQLRICVQLIPALVLLAGISTGARSLAAIDDSVTRGRIAWNAADSKQKQIEAHNLDEFERRAPIETTGRSVLGRIRHYVGTHKELLASDALLIATLSADGLSSVHCVNLPNDICFETNRLLPNHPTELIFLGYFTGVEAIFIIPSHVWWHRNPDSPWRHLLWIAPIACAIAEASVVKSNWEFTADNVVRLQEARARVSR